MIVGTRIRRAVPVTVACLSIVAGPATPAHAEATAPALSASQGPPGTVVTASAQGWVGCQSIGLSGWGQSLANAAINGAGSFEMRFRIPANAPTGTAQLVFSPTCAHSTWMPFASFTVTAGGGTGSQLPDLQPAAITFDSSQLVVGTTIHFDSGVANRGPGTSTVFNIKWFVDGRDVGAYGSHLPVPGNTLVMDGNSQFDWRPDAPGAHTITFTLDVDGHVAESVEGNNSVSVPVVVRQQTDPGRPWAYDAGRYRGKSVQVSVNSTYVEPNERKYFSYCGPAASMVLISHWTSQVPSMDELGRQQKTGPDGTYLANMVAPINNAIGRPYYRDGGAAGTESEFSNRLGSTVFDGRHPIITGIWTRSGQHRLNGWGKYKPVRHIITIYGFDFTSADRGLIYYVETAGTGAGSTVSGSQFMDYESFWNLVKGNDIQLIAR